MSAPFRHFVGLPENPSAQSADRPDPQPSVPTAPKLQRAARLAAVVAALVAGSVLAAWATDALAVAQWGAQFVPMAPTTAFAVLALAGAIWQLAAIRPTGLHAVGRVLAGTALALCGNRLLGLTTGLALPIDEAFATGRHIGGVPVGVMAMVTAGSLATLAAALLLAGARSAWCRQIAVGMAIAAAAVGAVVVFGYLYGEPVHYNGADIPMAWPTGVCLLLLASSVVLLGGTDVWPTRDFIGDSVRAQLVRAFVPMSVLFAIAQGLLTVRVARWHSDALPFLTAVACLAATLPLAAAIGMVARLLSQALERAEVARCAQLQKIAEATGAFVPRDYLRMLGRDSVLDVQLGDQALHQMTILFSDLRSFTTLSEAMTPGDTFAFLNEYLGRMEPIIRAEGGFVDKYVGDAIVALFPPGPNAAVRAAVAMQHALAVFNAERLAKGLAEVQAGIGINAGSVMVGTIGAAGRMDSTVIGDAVNLAARVEGLTKDLGACILVTDHARDLLTDDAAIAMRWMGHAEVKGKRTSVSLFEVFSADPPELLAAKVAAQPLFEQAVAAQMAESWSAAESGFRRCLEEVPADVGARQLLERCRWHTHRVRRAMATPLATPLATAESPQSFARD